MTESCDKQEKARQKNIFQEYFKDFLFSILHVFTLELRSQRGRKSEIYNDCHPFPINIGLFVSDKCNNAINNMGCGSLCPFLLLLVTLQFLRTKKYLVTSFSHIFC